jgi:hypothetical protein
MLWKRSPPCAIGAGRARSAEVAAPPSEQAACGPSTAPSPAVNVEATYTTGTVGEGGGGGTVTPQVFNYRH